MFSNGFHAFVCHLHRQQQVRKSRSIPRSMYAHAFNYHGDTDKTAALRGYLGLPFVQTMLQGLGEQLDRSQWAVDKYKNVISARGAARCSAVKGEIDHRDPFARCQQTELDNLQPLHWLANCRKGCKSEEEVPVEQLACGVKAETFVEFMQLLRELRDGELQTQYWSLLVKQDMPKEWRDRGADAYVKQLICRMQGNVQWGLAKPFLSLLPSLLPPAPAGAAAA